MIIDKKKPVFGLFGEICPGVVFSDYYDGDIRETYMKIQDVIISRDGLSGPICNAVDIETGEWTFFDEDEKIVPYYDAKITLE